MTGDAVLVVADTLAAHLTIDGFAILACNVCNMRYDSPASWASHVAAAVVDALGGLTREWAVRTGLGDLIEGVDQDTALYVNEQDNDGGEGLGRWVSGWVREPAEEGKP